MRFAFSLLYKRQLDQSTLMVQVFSQKSIIFLLQFIHLIYLLLEI